MEQITDPKILTFTENLKCLFYAAEVDPRLSGIGLRKLIFDRTGAEPRFDMAYLFITRGKRKNTVKMLKPKPNGDEVTVIPELQSPEFAKLLMDIIYRSNAGSKSTAELNKEEFDAAVAKLHQADEVKAEDLIKAFGISEDKAEQIINNLFKTGMLTLKWVPEQLF